MNKNVKSASSVDIQIGRKIKLTRVMQNLNQKELAEELGITFQQVQKYENGVNRISAGRLIEIAKALKTSVVFFFQGLEDEGFTNLNPVGQVAEKDGDKNAFNQKLPEKYLNNESLELLNAFWKIKDAGIRNHILSLANELSGEGKKFLKNNSDKK